MKKFFALTFFLALAGCASQPPAEVDVKALIQASLDRTSRATSSEDIDAYMAELPPDFSIVDESGEIITRDKQKEYVLRDWSVIEKTLDLTQVIESLEVNGETANVITSQRWERLMQRPDKSGTDTVLTTQRHRETWKFVNGRWYAYEIVELGGEIFVNGRPYSPVGT
jgi:hypothetical protein